MATTRRIAGIDFWRGFVLCCIFVNHIPGNLVGYLTPRNVGFSDAAEAFVFLSGLSVALAYANRFRRDPASAAAPILRRAGQIYIAHILITCAGLLLYAIAFTVTDDSVWVTDDGRSVLLLDPQQGMLAILSLGHQPGYYNILPLYLALLAFTPVLLALGVRDRRLMILASAAVYVLARALGLNLPSWPEANGWFFNPFTWQFVFAIGLFFGLGLREEAVPYRGWLMATSLVVVIASAIVVSNAFGMVPGLVDEAGRHLDWDKSTLGTVRLVNFLCMVYVLCQLPLTEWLRRTPLFDPMTRLGRNSLVVFSAGTLLSTVGQILTDTWHPPYVFDLAYVAAGIFLLDRLANLIEWHAKLSNAPESSRGRPS